MKISKRRVGRFLALWMGFLVSASASAACALDQNCKFQQEVRCLHQYIQCETQAVSGGQVASCQAQYSACSGMIEQLCRVCVNGWGWH